jgi:hypothetical protein
MSKLDEILNEYLGGEWNGNMKQALREFMLEMIDNVDEPITFTSTDSISAVNEFRAAIRGEIEGL